MSTAFATLITAAEARENKAAMLQEERQAVAAEANKAKAAEVAAARQQADLLRFGRNFVAAVASRVVNHEWKSDYLKMVAAYTEGLLMKTDVVLPAINKLHAAAILDKLEYGLKLSAQRGVVVPEGFFYGQRLLSEREVSASKVSQSDTRLVIVKGDRPRHPQVAVSSADTADLKPATTPPVKKNHRAK